MLSLFKRKLIVVEGPDASGKSTLCKTLQLAGCELIDTRRKPDLANGGDLLFDQYMREKPRLGPPLLLDRHCLSDVAYGLMRDSNFNCEEAMSQWSWYCRHFNMHLVLLSRAPFTEGYSDEHIVLTPQQDAKLVLSYSVVLHNWAQLYKSHTYHGLYEPTKLGRWPCEMLDLKELIHG